MLIFTLFAALMASAAAVAYVAWPMIRPGTAPLIAENSQMSELVSRKEATLIAIKELEFDYNTGKLSEEDYQRMDQRLRRQAIGYIKAIDKLAPESAQMEGRMEAEISAMRKTNKSEQVAASETDRSAGQSIKMSYCTKCGNSLKPTHKFCGICGTPNPAFSDQDADNS